MPCTRTRLARGRVSVRARAQLRYAPRLPLYFLASAPLRTGAPRQSFNPTPPSLLFAVPRPRCGGHGDDKGRGKGEGMGMGKGKGR
ncbi:hypothetical protein K431DRAFT_289026 [Polychaeton citri CBS 116435]|uniref:Uncharacterized protein n=1 Tax=Polychaeton citri CBS 116435 TaxID=1314669 RepID=A0A9P4Q2I8_9PEZI|nr:hypothetical protein K431DRAFT_289026 [Polychaeton citri CBS 116435]